jgi:hypothetical protein
MITRPLTSLQQQVNLRANLRIGSGRVDFTTGRRCKDGTEEALLVVTANNDRQALKKARTFLDHALAEQRPS